MYFRLDEPCVAGKYFKKQKEKKMIELMYIFCATESETTAESETRHVEAG